MKINNPHTLHPTPYTPHPTPYTPHPTPHTLHPAPHPRMNSTQSQGIRHHGKGT
ncbi:hypothetical protein [Microcystis sp. M169S2]|uniref:hypothetical protein n=1 Tax=Microcystis sp. M169S2 TaxID=2771157 RepID=UPI00258C2B64|nr:hypothetical protein [Microcystis sp. M169S2]